uniref:Uncharacterized protein n=2 Tax=Oryza TaxID=4527 RepID=A0A0E0Q6I4_ORYRU
MDPTAPVLVAADLATPLLTTTNPAERRRDGVCGRDEGRWWQRRLDCRLDYLRSVGFLKDYPVEALACFRWYTGGNGMGSHAHYSGYQITGNIIQMWQLAL